MCVSVMPRRIVPVEEEYVPSRSPSYEADTIVGAGGMSLEDAVHDAFGTSCR